MKISILIPTFNREKYIQIAIKSILEQTYNNLKLIIYDDGSTDNTVSIINKMMQRYKNITLITATINMGVPYARNQLIQACDTDYACWQDSDDISMPNRLEFQVKKIKNNLNTIVFCDWMWYVYYARIKEWKTQKRNNNCQAFATLLFPVNKDIKFRESLKTGGEDWDWIKQMKEIYGECTVDGFLYCVRSHEDRIGKWKLKILAKIPKDIREKMSYKEMIEYYKENYE